MFYLNILLLSLDLKELVGFFSSLRPSDNIITEYSFTDIPNSDFGLTSYVQFCCSQTLSKVADGLTGYSGVSNSRARLTINAVETRQI